MVKQNAISWDINENDLALVLQISSRAEQLAEQNRVYFDKLRIEMDITAVHVNGTKLDLAGLLEADDFNFVHDVFGITRHINRVTGKLDNCFIPRFAVK